VAWLDRLRLSGAIVLLPEIAVYEVGRELKRLGAAGSLRRLDDLRRLLFFLPITTPAMELASDLWADVRRRGVPTAAPDSLDADCILAAQALCAAGAGDTVTIATTNPAHLARFPEIDARIWDTIA
jgi:predicted nucleic acid-binding protein